MHDFLDHVRLAPKPLVVRRRYARPDSYAAAATLIGVSRTHIFEIFQGKRTTTPEKTEALRKWATENARKGRNDSPAVAAALTRLGAA